MVEHQLVTKVITTYWWMSVSHVAMHGLFQKDLFSLKLNTSRSYVKTLATSMAPMVTGHGGSFNISAQVIIHFTQTHNHLVCHW